MSDSIVPILVVGGIAAGVFVLGGRPDTSAFSDGIELREQRKEAAADRAAAGVATENQAKQSEIAMQRFRSGQCTPHSAPAQDQSKAPGPDWIVVIDAAIPAEGNQVINHEGLPYAENTLICNRQGQTAIVGPDSTVTALAVATSTPETIALIDQWFDQYE